MEASQAGVPVTLFVRGISCIVPGLEGLTENVRVVSIVGRLLEHSRIYGFGPRETMKLYLSSADLMTRNMDKRIEIAWPILNDGLREQILGYLDVSLDDTAKLRELLPDKSYTPLGAFARKDGEGATVLFDSQEFFIKQAQEHRLSAAEEAAARTANRGRGENGAQAAVLAAAQAAVEAAVGRVAEERAAQGEADGAAATAQSVARALAAAEAAAESAAVEVLAEEAAVPEALPESQPVRAPKAAPAAPTSKAMARPVRPARPHKPSLLVRILEQVRAIGSKWGPTLRIDPRSRKACAARSVETAQGAAEAGQARPQHRLGGAVAEARVARQVEAGCPARAARPRPRAAAGRTPRRPRGCPA